MSGDRIYQGAESKQIEPTCACVQHRCAPHLQNGELPQLTESVILSRRPRGAVGLQENHTGLMKGKIASGCTHYLLLPGELLAERSSVYTAAMRSYRAMAVVTIG
jgi:hypothetical protein